MSGQPSDVHYTAGANVDSGYEYFLKQYPVPPNGGHKSKRSIHQIYRRDNQQPHLYNTHQEPPLHNRRNVPNPHTPPRTSYIFPSRTPSFRGCGGGGLRYEGGSLIEGVEWRWAG
ncbi:hypothetical protein BDQ17DRAFT_1048749 [Cyathus striatus]|nr:hypothetical protein BDQ17DRAFT_1048749 [Cyathus striatus]